MDYHFSKQVAYDFQQAQERTIVALKEEGFGVISEIDLKEKFQEKLGIDFRNYKILGACNPQLAYRAIEQEDKIGIMLPCNVLLQEHPDTGVEVTAINPMEAMATIDNPQLHAIAREVSQKLKTVIDKI